VSAPGHHTGPVAAVSARGHDLVSGAYDGAVARWRVDLAQRRVQLASHSVLHSKGVNVVAVANDGIVGSGGSDGRALVIDTAGNALREISHGVDVEALAFSADCQTMATGGTDGQLCISYPGRFLPLAVRHGKTVGAVLSSSGGFFTGCNDGKIRFVSNDGSAMRVVGMAEGPVKSLASAGRHVFAGSHDNTIRVLKAGGRAPVVASFSTTPKSLAMSPRGDELYVGTYDQSIHRFLVRRDGGLEPIDRVRSARHWAHGLTAGDGFVAVGAFDGAPIVYARDGAKWVALEGPDAQVPCISTMAIWRGELVFGGDAGILWQGRPGGPVMARLPGAVTALAAADSSLFVGTWDGEVWLLSDRGEPRRLWQTDRPVLSVAADGTRVLVGLYTGGAVLLDSRNGAVIWRLQESTGATKRVDLQGALAVVTGRYDPARIVDARSGDVVGRLSLNTSVSDVIAFRPANWGEVRHFAVCGGAHEIWIAVVTPDGVSVIEQSQGHRLPVKALAWVAPNIVAAGDYAGQIRLHQAGRPSQLLAAVPCRLGVSALVADGTLLHATTFDGTHHTYHWDRAEQ
jgi:outer membrane protein assembly factor BamB